MKIHSISVQRFFLAAALVTIVSGVTHTLIAFFTMPYYLDPNFFSVWSKVMMPVAGPPPTLFYVLTLVFGLLAGFVYAELFLLTRKELTASPILSFAALIAMISLVIYYLPVYLLINIPLGLLIWWFGTDIVISLIISAGFSKILK